VIFSSFVISVTSFERSLNEFRSVNEDVINSVIPAWKAGIQDEMDVSGSVLANLDAGYPCRHDEHWVFSSSIGRA
jgi:hypothetical protein